MRFLFSREGSSEIPHLFSFHHFFYFILFHFIFCSFYLFALFCNWCSLILKNFPPCQMFGSSDPQTEKPCRAEKQISTHTRSYVLGIVMISIHILSISSNGFRLAERNNQARKRGSSLTIYLDALFIEKKSSFLWLLYGRIRLSKVYLICFFVLSYQKLRISSWRSVWLV